jgi:hypothetical protein
MYKYWTINQLMYYYFNSNCKQFELKIMVWKIKTKPIFKKKIVNYITQFIENLYCNKWKEKAK